MLRCITSGSYNQRCDILEKISVWDPDSYTSSESWERVNLTVPCSTMPFINGGIKGSGMTEKWDEGMYVSDDYIKIKTKVPLLKSYRITNIKSIDGELIWREEEFDDEPTMFNVDGSAPVTDPFSGKIIEYVSILSRAEIQHV